MLIVAYMLVLARAGSMKKALGVGLLALALVAPVVIYNYLSFAPSNSADFAEAQEILAHFRIPHHAEVARWLDGIAVAQLAWMAIGVALVRRSPLFTIMLVVFVFSVLLTVVQVIAANDSLALLFPWRTSAILVPIATAIILGKLVNRLDPWLARDSVGRVRAVQITCTLVIACMTASGAAIMLFGWGYGSNADELPLLDFVRAHKQRGETYLLPASIPKSDSGARGAFSTNFTPAPRPGTHLIAIDLQRFRIYAGAPIYVDFKCIPYRDVEVIEWKQRLIWNRDMYDPRPWDAGSPVPELSARAITHVVTTASGEFASPELERVYQDANYAVYALKK